MTKLSSQHQNDNTTTTINSQINNPLSPTSPNYNGLSSPSPAAISSINKQQQQNKAQTSSVTPTKKSSSNFHSITTSKSNKNRRSSSSSHHSNSFGGASRPIIDSAESSFSESGSSPFFGSFRKNTQPNLSIPHQLENTLESDYELEQYLLSLPKHLINKQDIYGRTLLHLAAYLNDEKYTEILLKHPQIDTLIQDLENGWTPLHIALLKGHMAIAQLLLAYNVDASNIKDRAKQRPIDILKSSLGFSFKSIPLEETFSLLPASRVCSNLVAYGSNTNHTLGFHDGDDKSYPQIVKISRDLQISKTLFTAKISKSVSITDLFSDNNNNIEHDGNDSRGNRSETELDEEEGGEEEEEDINDEQEEEEEEEVDSNENIIGKIKKGHKPSIHFLHAHNRHTDSLKHKLSKIPVNSPAAKFFPLKITDIKLSKYHSIVLSSDDIGNIYVVGAARGGRLGLGPKFLSTQFTFKQIPILANKRVTAVSAGNNHTIILTSDGKIYTCGSNEYGQLGYQINIKPGAKYPEQYTPKRVTNASISTESIIGVAASKIHSVAYSENYLLIWGKNIGQMGFTHLETSYSSAKEITDPKDGGIIQETPRVYTGISAPILQVVACEIATIYLVDDNSVWVLMNGENFKIKFPSFDTLETTSFLSYQLKKPLSGKIIKISVSSKGSVCALDDIGIIYSFNLRPHYVEPNSLMAHGKEAPLKGHQISKNIKVKALWKTTELDLRAIDVDIADDGSIILCTQEGTVWRSTTARSRTIKQLSTNKQSTQTPTMHNNHLIISPYVGSGTKYYYEQVFQANRIYKVRCDALFSSFAMLRDEFKPDAIGVNYSLSKMEYAHLLSRFEAGDMYPMNEYFSSILPKQNYNTYFPRIAAVSLGGTTRQKNNHSNTNGNDYSHNFKLFDNERSELLSNLIGNTYHNMSYPGDSTKPYFPDHIERHYDLAVFLVNEDTHKRRKVADSHILFLLARFPKFSFMYNAVNESSSSTTSPKSTLTSKNGEIKITLELLTSKKDTENDDETYSLTFSGVKLVTVESLMAYIYTSDFFFGREKLPNLPQRDEKDDATQIQHLRLSQDKPDEEETEDQIFDPDDVRLEIYKLCRVFGIIDENSPSTWSFMSGFFNGDQKRIGKDLQNLIRTSNSHLSGKSSKKNNHSGKEIITTRPDVIITLKDDIKIHLHSFILASRSAYFAALFSRRWYNPETTHTTTNDSSSKDTASSTTGRRTDPQIVFNCNLKEISTPVFQMVVDFIYGDSGVGMFNSLLCDQFATENDFIEFIKNVWVAADMLTLVRLSDICQAVLGDFSKLLFIWAYFFFFHINYSTNTHFFFFKVTINTVCDFFEFCQKYDGFKLKRSCTQYIFENLDFLFENGYVYK